MDNRSFTFKVIIILILALSVFLPAEDNVSAENPFINVGKNGSSYYSLVQDTASNIWINTYKDLYGYSKDGLKKYTDKGSDLNRIWAFDTLYAMCGREGDFSLKIMGKSGLKEICASKSVFNFFLTKKGDKILVNGRGEIILNGRVLEKLNLKKAEITNLDVYSMMFSEEIPGSVWIWSKDHNVHNRVFEGNILLLQNENIFRVSCKNICQRVINAVIEPAAGVVYISHFWDNYQCTKISYAIKDGEIKAEKDAGFDGKTFVPGAYQRTKDGKLWVLSMDMRKNINDLYYYSEGNFILYAADVGGGYPLIKDKILFMLEDNGIFWLSKGKSQGVNLVMPGGKIKSYDSNQGVNVKDPRQIIRMPDNNILLVSADYNDIRKGKAFQVLKHNSAEILSAIKLEKFHEEFETGSEIFSDSKGNYYWLAGRAKSYGTLCKFDGKNTSDIVNAYAFKKEKEKEYPALKYSSFKSFGFDSNDDVWMVFSKISGVKEKKYAVILKNDGAYQIEDFLGVLLKKILEDKNFQIKFMSKSVSFIFNPPDMILSFGKETGISKGGGYYPGFKEIICYKNNNGTEEIIVKKFKDLEEKEYILPQFNKTPEGQLYFTTWSGSSEKNSYFHDNGEWVRSEMFLPGKQLEEENRDIVPDDLKIKFGKDIVRAIKCPPDLTVFTLTNSGLYLKKGTLYYKFVNIPGDFYTGGDNLGGAFTDNAGALWIGNGKYSRTWIRIKKENIAAVIRLLAAEDIKDLTASGNEEDDSDEADGISPGKTKKAVRSTVLKRDSGRNAGKTGEFVEIKENITGEKVAVADFKAGKGSPEDFEVNYKKLLSGNKKDITDAGNFFLDNGDKAITFLNGKKEKIGDENVIWKIDALLSRMK